MHLIMFKQEDMSIVDALKLKFLY